MQVIFKASSKVFLCFTPYCVLSGSILLFACFEITRSFKAGLWIHLLLKKNSYFDVVLLYLRNALFWRMEMFSTVLYKNYTFKHMCGVSRFWPDGGQERNFFGETRNSYFVSHLHYKGLK